MIFIRHHETCAGTPNTSGKLTSECDCKVAPLDEDARKRLKQLLGELAGDSLKSGEETEYFALRLDMLADVITQDATGCRRTAKRSDRDRFERRRKSLASEASATLAAAKGTAPKKAAERRAGRP